MLSDKGRHGDDEAGTAVGTIGAVDTAPRTVPRTARTKTFPAKTPHGSGPSPPTTAPAVRTDTNSISVGVGVVVESKATAFGWNIDPGGAAPTTRRKQ
jgi:hypothetical protein